MEPGAWEVGRSSMPHRMLAWCPISSHPALSRLRSVGSQCVLALKSPTNVVGRGGMCCNSRLAMQISESVRDAAMLQTSPVCPTVKVDDVNSAAAIDVAYGDVDSARQKSVAVVVGVKLWLCGVAGMAHNCGEPRGWFGGFG